MSSPGMEPLCPTHEGFGPETDYCFVCEAERLKAEERKSAVARNEAQNCAHELRDVVRDQKARIDAALALHFQGYSDSCFHCGAEWPCPTDKALRGEKEVAGA